MRKTNEKGMSNEKKHELRNAKRKEKVVEKQKFRIRLFGPS